MPKILVADDSKTIQKVIRITLDSLNYDIIECTSEKDLFNLNIPEGCVMNRLIQPENLRYDQDGMPSYKVACCMLKQEVRPE